MRTSDFDYYLPQELIAQNPVEPRDSSRLMVLNRRDGSISHQTFRDIGRYLVAGDVLVFNDSRVIPARLNGVKEQTGGKVEILLLRQHTPHSWEALVKPGKRVRAGTRVLIGDSSGRATTTAEVIGSGEDGIAIVTFSDELPLSVLGKVPLPPYIRFPLADPGRYQTVYAKEPGSVAAPTAGLHFTVELIQQLQAKGVECLFTTLHVGLDTFRPVQEEDPCQHNIHCEYGVVNHQVATRINQAKAEGRRVICVGTTSVRLLEAAAQASEPSCIRPFSGLVDLFVLPGHQFRVVDAMVTNYHLPRSTLLMLVSAFAGREFVLRAYQEAIAQKYRFYSFGDTMLIL